MSIRQKLPTLSNRRLVGIALGAIAVLILTLVMRSADKPATTTVEPSPEIPAVAAPLTTAPADPVLDLFNPSEASLSEQLSASALKGRLEEVITTSFILKRCGLVSDSEYNETYRALMTYAQTMQPTLSAQQVQSNFTAVVESGSASYGLIYSRLSCDTPQLRTTAAQLAQWRQAILNPPSQ